jgi:hypothetical protein
MASEAVTCPARRPLHQRHAQLPLDLADRPRQRGLRHTQPFGRPSEVQFLGDGYEISELSDLQIVHTSTVSMAL